MTPFAHLSPRPWVRAAVAIYAVLLALVLLSPEPVEHVLGLRTGAWESVAEQVANVLIFIPVGFVAAWWVFSRWGAVYIGVFVSLSVEVAQFLWLPQRDPSWIDVVNNVFGTTVGALLYRVPPSPPR